MSEIRIYVADLAAYNNGKIQGVWIDACDDLDSIQEKINSMLANSPEDLAEEYEGINELHEIACFITEYPALGGELLSQFCGNLDDAKQAIGMERDMEMGGDTFTIQTAHDEVHIFWNV